MFSYSLLTIALASFVIPCLCQVPEGAYPCYDFADCKDGPDKEKLIECLSKLTEKDKETVAKHLATHMPDDFPSGDFDKNREQYCALEDREPVFKSIFSVYADYYMSHCQLPGDKACDRMMDCMDCFSDLAEEMDEDGRCKD